MQWSPQQSNALSQVSAWLNDISSQQVFYLAGFAGTGKTTLAKHFAEDYETLFAAYTGKAALAMRKSGISGASTIHSILYDVLHPPIGKIRELEAMYASNPTPDLAAELRELKKPQFVIKEDSPIADAELLVLDECSMIDEEMAQDILQFGGKVLVLGDPMQLPPVKGTGYFVSKEPDITLTEIHRQALDNPIIALSLRVREGGDIPIGFSEKAGRLRPGQFKSEMAAKASQIITGKNVTRHRWNDIMRASFGRKGTYPVIGDKLICLRNSQEYPIFNGMFAEVIAVNSTGPINYGLDLNVQTELEDSLENIEILSTVFDARDKECTVPYRRQRELQQFDYGYCITVHKSQGSQFDDVLLVDDKFLFWDKLNRTRWLYTAVTRAVDSVMVI